MPEYIIKIEDLNFSYENRIKVLENVELSLVENDSSCIVGPNGGGKSTLLKLILGLLKPDSGSIRIFGKEPEKVRNKIGYVPQYTLFDPMFPVNVMDVILMGRVEKCWLGPYSSKDRSCAVASLENMGIANLQKRRFSELSGGQRQRALIARALVSEPKLLLLDEPTANVDPVVEEQIFDLIMNLSSKMTIITVSHDLGFVGRIFKHVVCVNKRVAIHPTSELTGETIQEIYGRELSIVHHQHECESLTHD